MIGYFDTSALVKLVVEEEGRELAVERWAQVDSALCVRVGYPEGRAALAAAARQGRLTDEGLVAAVADFEARWSEIDVVEVDAALGQQAGELAQSRALRGYDAVHLAACLRGRPPASPLVVVCWDAALRAAAAAEGFLVSPEDSI